MTAPRTHPPGTPVVALWILVVIQLMGAATPGFLPAFTLGAVHAAPPVRQKEVGNSATESAAKKDGALNAMEALSDLATTRPVTREFVRALEARIRDVKTSETTLRREREELELLRQDVAAKLVHLEKLRAELEEMTRQVDRTRKKDLAKAVQVYAAMEPAQAAMIFNQMELESVVAILKEMDVETAGGILDAMTQQPGTDSARLGKLKAIGESLVDSKKLKKP